MDQKNYLKQVRAKAAKYCSSRERAPAEVFKKLISWELTEDEAESVMTELRSMNFINDERFSRAFCLDKFRFNHWGKQRLRMELRSRYQLNDDLIEYGLSEINTAEYEEVVEKLADKKWRQLQRESDDYIKKNKTANYLLGKGFESDLIWKAINKLALD